MARVVNTNRKIAPKAIHCNLEFSRCIAMGEKTKCNAEVDDTLLNMNNCTHIIWKFLNLELQFFETSDIHSLDSSMSQGSVGSNSFFGPGCSLEANFYQRVSQSARELQGLNKPKIHALDIEAIEPCASFSNQVP